MQRSDARVHGPARRLSGEDGEGITPGLGLCTYLRAAAPQAYNASAGAPLPGFVAFNFSVSALPPALFTAAVVTGVEGAVAAALGKLSLPLVVASDVLVMGVSILREGEGEPPLFAGGTTAAIHSV